MTLAETCSSTVFERCRVSGPSSLHVWFFWVPSEDLHPMIGRGGVGCVDANKRDAAAEKVVFPAAYGISATVGNYFTARRRAPRCGPYCGHSAPGPLVISFT